jgi:acyl-CoA synthetase (AMP-forming)/AMP-acid ligase II
MPTPAAQPSDLVNVAAYLPEMARRQPAQSAVIWSSGRDQRGRPLYARWNFAELNQEVDRLAHGLRRAGILRGTRTILMVRPSPAFFALTFALLKVGAVPVLIDPGMGRESMVKCLSDVTAAAFIGVPLAHLFRVLHRRAFKSVRVCITVGRRWCWGGLRLRDIRCDPWRSYDIAPTDVDEPAAIIFTTGSTGPPKGVLYTHGNFAAQVGILRDHFKIEPGEIDLPTFLLFGLFDPALGMTAVLPEMDPTRPALVDPEKIIGPIRDHRVTNMFGSPALLDRVARYGQLHGAQLPSLRRVVSAGAPVAPAILECFSKLLSGEAEVHTPYGATEALPVASLGSREILGETSLESRRGCGTCVGPPMPGIEVRIISITDEAIEQWSPELVLPTGRIGEIAVKGSVVTRRYHTDEAATKLAKIQDGNDIWHRMGDLGWLDDRGRLWFCGRKTHRVATEHGTLFSVPCEAIFNQHPQVFRSALVGLGPPPRQRPVICVELEPDAIGADGPRLRRELLDLAKGSDLTKTIHTILFHPSFPVDIRHNAKISREKLAVWAARQLRQTPRTERSRPW